MTFLKSLLLALLVAFSAVFTGCSDDDDLSNETGIVEFKLKNAEHAEKTFKLDQTALAITNADEPLAYKSAVNELIPVFTTVDKVTIKMGETVIENGVTKVDFTNPVKFKAIAEDGKTVKEYTVTVVVSQVNPDGAPIKKKADKISEENFNGSKIFEHNGKIYVWGLTDGGESVLYSSTDGTAWNKENLQDDILKLRMFSFVKFNNKFYIIGGVTGSGWGASAKSSVWESADLATWTLVNENTEAESNIPRNGSGISFVMGNKLYLTGTRSFSFGALQAPSSNVYSTTDGVTWTKETATQPEGMSIEPDAATFYHKGKFYISGGYRVDYTNATYVTADGITWTKIESNYKIRTGHSIYSNGEKLFLMGGKSAVVTGEGDDETTTTTLEKDYLVSEDDGLTWNAIEDASLPGDFKARYKHSIFIDSNKNLWVIGGSIADPDNDGQELSIRDVWSGKLNIVE